jgi:hypothetical protein
MKKFLNILFVLVFLAGTFYISQPAKATSSVITVAGFPVDISIPTWTPIGMTNITGDGVWDTANTVNGTSTDADFIMHYQKLVDPSHYLDCPTGWDVDPNNEGQCIQTVIVGATYNEAVTHEITVVDKEAWDETIVDKAGYTIHHDAITHVEHQTRTGTYVEETSVCPTKKSAYIYENASHHDCKWATKIDGKWHYADKVVTPAHWDWSAWSAWSDGKCLGTGKLSCPVPDVQCQERTVIDKEAWDEVVPPVTHIVHHEAITHTEIIVDQKGYYSCDEGYTLDGETCTKVATQSRGSTENEYQYEDQEFVVTPAWKEPPKVWLQLWLCDGSSLCFNVNTPAGAPRPDAGCFIYDYSGEIIPSSSAEIYCDVAPNASYHLVFSGWVRLVDFGKSQSWDNGAGDAFLAKINAEHGWHLQYMWFFKGYGGH